MTFTTVQPVSLSCTQPENVNVRVYIVSITLQCCRAYSIDRQLVVDAKAAGFAIEEEMGTRQPVGGSLEGVVYSLTTAKT